MFSLWLSSFASRKSSALICSLTLLLALAAGLRGQEGETRPKSEELLPESTVLYIQIENIRDLVEKFRDANIGRMFQDERIQPLADELYNQALDAYADIEENVGLSMDELQSLPDGEICFALIAPKRKNLCGVVIMDIDPENEAVNKAIERGREFAASRARLGEDDEAIDETDDESDDEPEETTEESDDTNDETGEADEDGAIFETISANGRKLTMFRKGRTLVGGNNEEVVRNILERWMDRPVEKVRPLSQNRKFVTIMNRCRGTKDTPPEMRIFADPIQWAKTGLRGNFAAQAALNFFPTLGLDGLLGVGGAVLMNEQEFESVFHGHLLLSNPRKGIFEMVSLKPDEYRPQIWVPEDISQYMTTSWDVPTMFAELRKILDVIVGEGRMDEWIEENINEEVGFVLEEDVINNLSGRVTYIQWIEQPARINSTTNILSLGVNDVDKAKEVIDLLIKKASEDQGEDVVEQKVYNGQDYWTASDSAMEETESRQLDAQERRLENGGRSVSVDVRIPRPCVTIIDDQVIICDSFDAFKKIVDTAQGDLPGLVDNEEFDVVGRKITRLLGTDMPSALFFSRPAEQFKLLFDLAKSENSKDFLEEIGEENAYVGRLKDAMDDNPLPEFEEIKHYFPPQGTFITDDDTGYHILTFQMRAKDEPDQNDNN